VPNPAEAEKPRMAAAFSGQFWIMTVRSDMVAHLSMLPPTVRPAPSLHRAAI